MIVGFDVGGSKISLFLSSRDGRILYRDRVRTPAMGDPMDLVDTLAGMTRIAEERSGTPAEIISIAFAGAVDGKSGVIHASPNLFGGKEIPISSIMEDLLGKSVYVENDATAVAISEKIFGVGRQFSNYIYLSLSTGIGGGIFANNHIYRGALGMAGEFGHMKVVEKGRLCGCGRNGCLESEAGGRAIANILEEENYREKSPYLAKIPGRALEALDLFEGAKAGDKVCIKLAESIAYKISSGIASLANIFDPEAIMLGGGLSNSKEFIFDKVRETVPKLMSTLGRNLLFYHTSPEIMELSPLAVVLYEEQIPGFNIERIVREMRAKTSGKATF